MSLENEIKCPKNPQNFNVVSFLQVVYCDSFTIRFWYKFTMVYCESVNLIGYITIFHLLIVNSYASVHITFEPDVT